MFVDVNERNMTRSLARWGTLQSFSWAHPGLLKTVFLKDLMKWLETIIFTFEFRKGANRNKLT